MSLVHGFVREAWQGRGGTAGAVFRTAMLPVETLFRGAVQLRNRRYDRDPSRVTAPEIPVVSVGNLSVGGTGKTPVSSWVIQVLQGLGARPGLVARGYGEDELLLHRRWTPHVPVVANPDRVAGIREARAAGADVVVLDDGFQHRRVGRDVDVVLVSAEEGIPGALLPRGPFREPLQALERAHVALVTRKSASAQRASALAREVERRFPGLVVGVVAFRPGPFTRLGGAEVGVPEVPVLVATGVARPASVGALVRSLGVDVEETVAFPDHHEFTDRDVARLGERARGRPVVVTEKDAVKLDRLAAAESVDVRVMGLVPDFESGEGPVEILLRKLVEEVR